MWLHVSVGKVKTILLNRGFDAWWGASLGNPGLFTVTIVIYTLHGHKVYNFGNQCVLSSFMCTLKLNCHAKGNSPSVSNYSELVLGLNSSREQDSSSNDHKDVQSSVGGRIWEKVAVTCDTHIEVKSPSGQWLQRLFRVLLQTCVRPERIWISQGDASCFRVSRCPELGM